MVRRISGLFLILFMLIAIVMACMTMKEAVRGTETPTLSGIMLGTWTPTFEKSLNKALPVEESVRNFWGGLEFSLFGQGRKGVLVGSGGWLFTDEEFSCLPQGEKNLENNLAFIKSVQNAFKSKRIELVVVVIPAKTRLYSEFLGNNIVPLCRLGVYEHSVNAVAEMGIRTQGLLTVMEAAPNKSEIFLKTDTHWTPEGARMAAVAIAETLKEYEFPERVFKTGMGEDKVHEGDLMRYLPGVPQSAVKPDILHEYATNKDETLESDAANDLFSEDIPPVALVGTSYSANTKWNFAGFLKEFLKADVLNMADEGLGPFTVMDKYLKSKALEETPPAVVVWEIPERYMTTIWEPSK